MRFIFDKTQTSLNLLKTQAIIMQMTVIKRLFNFLSGGTFISIVWSAAAQNAANSSQDDDIFQERIRVTIDDA